jgi:hypothetical protein
MLGGELKLLALVEVLVKTALAEMSLLYDML